MTTDLASRILHCMTQRGLAMYLEYDPGYGWTCCFDLAGAPGHEKYCGCASEQPTMLAAVCHAAQAWTRHRPTPAQIATSLREEQG